MDTIELPWTVNHSLKSKSVACRSNEDISQLYTVLHLVAVVMEKRYFWKLAHGVKRYHSEASLKPTGIRLGCENIPEV